MYNEIPQIAATIMAAMAAGGSLRFRPGLCSLIPNAGKGGILTA